MSRAYRSSGAGVAVVAVFILGLIFSVLFAAASGWLFMLAVGVAHAHWITTLPTIGYGTAFIIMVLLGAAFKFISIDVNGSTD